MIFWFQHVYGFKSLTSSEILTMFSKNGSPHPLPLFGASPLVHPCRPCHGSNDCRSWWKSICRKSSSWCRMATIFSPSSPDVAWPSHQGACLGTTSNSASGKIGFYLYIYINIYIYTYVCMYVCGYIYVYTYVCIHICIYIERHIDRYIHTYIHYITLHYITSHHITSHHITSHHITLHYIHTYIHR